MPVARRVYVSVPGDTNLTETQQQFKWALISKISGLGYIPEIFYSERPQSDSLAQGRNWSFAECSAVLRRCIGAIIIGLPRHRFMSDGETYDIGWDFGIGYEAIGLDPSGCPISGALTATVAYESQGQSYRAAGSIGFGPACGQYTLH